MARFSSTEMGGFYRISQKCCELSTSSRVSVIQPSQQFGLPVNLHNSFPDRGPVTRQSPPVEIRGVTNPAESTLDFIEKLRSFAQRGRRVDLGYTKFLLVQVRIDLDALGLYYRDVPNSRPRAIILNIMNPVPKSCRSELFDDPCRSLQYMNMVPFRNWRAEVVPKTINFPGSY